MAEAKSLLEKNIYVTCFYLLAAYDLCNFPGENIGLE